MRTKVIETICREKLVVILRGVPRENLIPLAEAMCRGGVRLMEVTYDAGRPDTDGETAEKIRLLVDHFGGRMLVGAGTVLTPEQAALTREVGGQFVISPDTNPQVIQKTRKLDMVSMPGAMTPSEIQAAHRFGADFVKVFPVVSLGPDYIKAVKAPLSHIRLLAVGGVNLGNLADYRKAGVCGFGIGSDIVRKDLLQKGDFEAITALAEQYRQALEQG